MNINRNNYEEYFLLYADKELSAAERNRVEEFVQQNIDLEEEFIMIQQSVVKPDHNISFDKSFLFKKDEFINQKNYEEVFVLYNDDELNEAERRQTETFVEENNLQKEFALYQQVKLQADNAIIFPDKKLLYKKERERVIPIWWRMAAAAVLAGAGLWFSINYLQSNKATIQQPVVVKLVEKKKDNIALPIIPKQEQQEKAEQQNLAVHENKLPSPSEKNIVKKNNDIIKNQTLNNSNDVVKNNQQVKIPDQKIIDPSVSNKAIQQNNNLAVKDPVVKINNLPVPEKTDKDIAKNTSVDVYNTTASNPNAQTVSYMSDEKNDNYVFYNVSEDKFKKSKLFGFLKKVKRVIERKSPFNHNSYTKEVATN